MNLIPQKPKLLNRKNVSAVCAGVLLCLSSSIFFSTPASASTEELKGVKGEITRQQKSLSQQQKELDKLQKQLKRDELSIANASKNLAQTRTSLKRSEANLKAYDQQHQELLEKTQAQAAALQKLVKSYYMMHTNAKIESFLSHESTQDKDRISQYYQHLAKQRAEVITELQQTNAKLEQKNLQLIAEQQQIETLLAQQSDQLNKQRSSQTSRKSTVAKIKRGIAGDSAYLNELKRNEARLKAEIAKAAKRNSVPMDGLAKQKGRLPWPVKGSVLHSYGSKQSGQVNWKGMVINAQYEQPVKAVYPGTVVFADYLRGYGLVLLLDHGKGDMTLYGYNQVLTKKEGDKVTSGETIALAGDTGGQSRSSVYFELRRNSQTQNPRSWLTR
ncbi:murein hydrolase activator EnvC [Vibrio breoganii]|uniref:murein hydrolase activator EnvC family protein n=1 Tax=Vibrio breoganii TaxID=553239 RepID=UPI000C858E47|nr:peptidoglycan DD-metalloendopeptidase family protein [Vibrio breoganii]PMG02017.1 peptidase M23 [Vibrio breoganii]PML12990.1 peptidase M23 [Vibrio breoganii]PML27320.1 peptidase M23 [Vibrio breoganii]